MALPDSLSKHPPPPSPSPTNRWHSQLGNKMMNYAPQTSNFFTLLFLATLQLNSSGFQATTYYPLGHGYSISYLYSTYHGLSPNHILLSRSNTLSFRMEESCNGHHPSFFVFMLWKLEQELEFWKPWAITIRPLGIRISNIVRWLRMSTTIVRQQLTKCSKTCEGPFYCIPHGQTDVLCSFWQLSWASFVNHFTCSECLGMQLAGWCCLVLGGVASLEVLFWKIFWFLHKMGESKIKKSEESDWCKFLDEKFCFCSEKFCFWIIDYPQKYHSPSQGVPYMMYL